MDREAWSYITVYDKLIFTKNMEYQTEKNEIRRWIVDHKIEILRDPYFTILRKIAILSLVISPWIYRKIVALSK